ncbi:molybdate ABC transporter permease subunit [Clostridium sp. Marseille-P299]|uniref:molybdate ABC transporter permease subunit n=1 Tax=Clostridium sp. Marseille-P299 TaxID=1805477 RepID=UPI00082FAC20|nr:molybdate ABC transporter permease subunit [Clostridium sp. Marseille-P299]
MGEFLAEINWSPLFISLKTGFVATIIAFFMGIFAASKVMRVNQRIKWILDGIFTLPLVLPPTVAGFFLLLLFSLKRPFGMYLYENFDIKLVQTWPGCVVAACVIAFPLMYRNTRAAFEQVDIQLIYAGRTLGMSETKIFWKIIIPLAGPGIASGTILAFARALGEYGATSMLAGNILGKTRTIAVAIASEVAAGNYDRAGFWVAVIMILSFLVIFLMNVISGKGMKGIGGESSWR